MASLAINRIFEAASLRRFLRKNFVERLVLASKGLLLIAGLAALAAAFLQSTKGEKETSARVGLFQEGLKPSLESIKKPPVVNTPSTDYSSLAGRSLFGPIGLSPTPKANAASQKTVSNLPLTLIGTFVSPGTDPYAIIEEQKKHSQEMFMLNDTVFGEAKIVAIFSDRVDISRNNRIETLTLDATPDKSPVEMNEGVASLGNDEYIVEEAELDKALENLPLLLTQARAVPYFKEGKSIGLRLFAIKGGSLFDKIGLKNGDVLKSVNGNSLADLSEAMRLFQRLKEEKSITVAMERNAVEKEFKYTIR